MHSHSRECILGRKIHYIGAPPPTRPLISSRVGFRGREIKPRPGRRWGEANFSSFFFYRCFCPIYLKNTDFFSKRSSFSLNNHLLKVWVLMSFELLNKMCCINGFWQSIHIHVVYTHEIQSHTYKILNL